ncbi:MAG TPA: AsmA-like C-terminal region-containing protein, partial [Saprospiraceae bacterium]|nr:AsmA-like C-terminal region-containing protein [Saprospiraceae bacterium]
PAPTPSGVPTAETTATTSESAIFDRFDFSLDAEAKELAYGDYKVKNGVARGNIKPNRLAVNQLSGQIGDSDFSANGVITNLFKYLFEDGVLGGQLELRSNYFNLNQFMAEEETTTAGGEAAASGSGTKSGTAETATASSDAGYGTIPDPPNIDLTAKAKIGKVVYTNMVLEDVEGDIDIADEAIVLDGVTARGLGGTMALSGSYDTKDIDNPGFSFKYNLQKLDFQQAFTTLNTFQQLAPIGQYIKGTFSSTMIMDGKLGNDMMPKLESLNAQGFLETINGIIQGFTPAKSLGEKLNVDYFKDDIKVTNTRNWFEIKNGVLELKEYDAKLKDINMRIGGTYSIADQLNLKIKAKVPRKLLEQNAIGAAASSGFNLLQQQASKLGLNIKQSEFVNVLVDLTGSMKDPKVGLKLLGMDGEENLTESVKEDAKAQAKEQLDAGKQVVKQTTNKAVDSLKTVANKKVDQAEEELKNKATEVAKEKLGTVLDSTAQKKADEILQGAGKEGSDKIKENLEKWNPFGKKKDKNKTGGN